MSQRRLEDWIESFLIYTHNTEPRESYRRWVAISTIAAVLQRKCFIRLGRETFFPNLYVVLVGPPAARKGTAMREGKLLLNKMGIQFSADETSRQKLITTMKECQAGEQGADGKIQYHSSMTIFSTELTVFLGYDAKEMLSMLCKWFDCEDRFRYDTHMHGKEEIPNVWANLLGATTPAQLQASLPEGAIGSGFTSRVIFVYEEDKSRIIVTPTVDSALEEPLLVDLGEIRNLCGEFTPTDKFNEAYSEWRLRSEDEGIFSDSRLEYYAQRRPTHLFKLALIYAASRGSEMEVTEHDLIRAIRMLEDTEKKMAQTFAGVGLNPLAGAQLRVLKLLRLRKSISIAELSDLMSNDLGYNQLSEVLSSLGQSGKVLVDYSNRRVMCIEKERGN